MIRRRLHYYFGFIHGAGKGEGPPAKRMVVIWAQKGMIELVAGGP